MGRNSTGGRTELHIIWNDNLTIERYADETLRFHVVPYVVAFTDSINLIYDKSRPPYSLTCGEHAFNGNNTTYDVVNMIS